MVVPNATSQFADREHKAVTFNSRTDTEASQKVRKRDPANHQSLLDSEQPQVRMIKSAVQS
jgi:hypothetical protein